MQISVAADLSSVGRLAKTLEKADATVLRWRVRQAVKDVGEAVLKNARQNASWSTGHTSGKGNEHVGIPSAITLRTSFGARSAGVTLKTDPKRAPHAYFYERGSKGSGGRYIKHPVYGSQGESAKFGVRARYDEKNTWRKTPTRPFFYKAAKEHGGDLAIRLKQELEAAVHELGFHL